MKLLTKEIIKKAGKQFPLGADMNQNVVAKFFDPYGSWKWYVMNIDPDDTNYAWGIVKGFAVEIGSISIEELTMLTTPWNTPRIERDMSFQPIPANECYEQLKKGEFV